MVSRQRSQPTRPSPALAPSRPAPTIQAISRTRASSRLGSDWSRTPCLRTCHQRNSYSRGTSMSPRPQPSFQRMVSVYSPSSGGGEATELRGAGRRIRRVGASVASGPVGPLAGLVPPVLQRLGCGWAREPHASWPRFKGGPRIDGLLLHTRLGPIAYAFREHGI